MSTTATLEACPTQGAARVLQSAVADLLALALVAKHAHWNVTGSLFRPLHALFDEMATSHLEAADRAAERLRALGWAVDGRPSTVSAATVVPEPPHALVPDTDAITRGVVAVEWVASRIRERFGQIEPADPVSLDLLTGILGGLDHFAWMLRAQA
jgi:starvation-inducible DNA-binding protein